MTSPDDNTQFIEAARDQGMLTQELASEVLRRAGNTDVAATMVLQQGLMDVRQVDMIQSLTTGRESVPGYTILDIIGHGGMGVVFRARQETLEREVALKTILVGGRMDEAIQRFRKEAKSIARLNHPNIVTAFDSGQHDGRIYLSMELVNGRNLTDYVEQREQLSETESMAITRQAALGLAHAWEQGIVHRDIKPDNLLITMPSEFDQTRTVKITDLGLAHLNNDTDARITQTGAAVGSPLFMAPEQLSGENIDCRADIYSLGSTLYFMLSGRAPFEGDSVASVLYNKAAGKSVPLASVCRVSDGTEQLVRQMMATDPAQRPQNYRSLVTAIDALESSTAGKAVPSVTHQSPAAPNIDPSLLETSLLETRPAPEAATVPTDERRIPVGILLVGIAAIAVGTVLLWPSPGNSPDPLKTEPALRMDSTWSFPLFSGTSVKGWEPSRGMEFTVDVDEVEQANVLSLNPTGSPDGHVTCRIPVPAGGEPWFEVESQLLLGSAGNGGILFDLTDSGPRFRVRVTDDEVVLSEVADEQPLSKITALPSPREHPVSIVLKLQPDGWVVNVNGQPLGRLPWSEDMEPKIRLFTEGGQAFFSEINAWGLTPAVDSP